MVSIEQKVREIITSHVDVSVDIDKVHSNCYLNTIGVNSINFIRSVLDLETEYSIEFDIDMLGFDSFETFGNLVKYVERKVS
ncbi:acyl carrier protein [Paenibacillus sp. FSL M7-0420]|uniref:acyl carrier protein n=1 Tax=Paenibacillus sp. FSL M7-0420 TaxID=2921609 RepID=UPI0030F4B675